LADVTATHSGKPRRATRVAFSIFRNQSISMIWCCSANATAPAMCPGVQTPELNGVLDYLRELATMFG
jgi:hypothetical protein